ncbi:hypothetical protein HC028_25265 [Planosporangium flavigriseum]|uniref:Uncharacterized protein n=1 Tax=Planosporangium flavigriseum TaxID=373681 RepID=A0A8J3LZ54_9ACTN|nr:hypothetical protein [Planosporangium flavigriseum]NJC67788.1 hypothetical protein [Planosporangium flavigriseum]GIG76045.1 hypothetical protein Pfl04_44490 [Planosporangium flavigriseum]
MTNPPDNSSAVPPADQPRQESPTTPLAPAAGSRPAWYRRLPGRLSIWIAAAALLSACVIGCVGFVAGAAVSHGFGDRGYHERGYNRDGGWGNDGQRGDEGDRRGARHEPHRKSPKPTPSSSTSAPTQSSSPSPSVSPTA